MESFARHGLRSNTVFCDVADLVQDVFIRAFAERGRLSYDGLRDYGPYVITIAKNLIIDRARRAGRELATEDGVLEELAISSEVEETPWAEPATMHAVEAYLAALPPALRELHQKRYVEGLPQREAASVLGISRQQLRTREAQLRAGLEDALRKAMIIR